MVNTFEGRMFIDPETRDTVHVQDYVSRLFPLFRGNQLHMVAKNYEHLGNPFSKVIQIMGEGEVVTLLGGLRILTARS